MLGWLVIAGLALLVLSKRSQAGIGAGLQWPAGTRPATPTQYPTGPTSVYASPIGYPTAQAQPGPPGVGAQQVGGLIGAGATVAAGSAALAGVGTSGTALAAAGPVAIVPVVGAVAAGAIALSYGLYKAFNHPYGTCGPKAKNSDDFLRCWSHKIPNGFMPYLLGPNWKDNFAVCPGATGGRPPVGGCKPVIQPSDTRAGGGGIDQAAGQPCHCTGQCVCAPVGATGWANGTWM